MYLDVAHGGWLGWDDNRAKVAQIFSEVLTAAGGSHLIRGFASNVANYSPLYRANPDPLPDSYYQWNPARDEVTYVQKLAETFAAYGIQNRNFLIDTSRNGNPVSRQTWGNWCNIARAGIGERPKAAPLPGVDAFLWVKPPGESDGVSETGAPRFDLSCQSSDSLLGAPQAGEWFHDHIVSMARNANPAL
jgi:cellulose 1,4-beta-cellobiosidase